MSFRVAFIAGASANEEFRSAMALSEYDGLFLDPENLRDPDASLLSRRRREIEILLSSGGVVVLFARRLIEIGSGVDNYSWLLRRPFQVVERSGTSVRENRRDNPFLEYFDAFGKKDSTLSFQVVLEQIPDDLPGRNVLAENKAGEVIGLLYRELNGTVAVLPPIREINDRFRSIITEVTRRLRERRSSLELAPEWVRSLPALPGEAERSVAIAELQAQIKELEARRDEEAAALEELRGLKALLWETGSLGLVPAVRHAFTLLGFDVEPRDERSSGSSIRMRDGEREVICEVDASEGPVQLEGFRRLHEAVTETLLERGVEAKGVLVGNGNRLHPIEGGSGRPTFAENCLGGCEKFGYTAAPGFELYRAIEAILKDRGDERKRAVRESLLGATGVWKVG